MWSCEKKTNVVLWSKPELREDGVARTRLAFKADVALWDEFSEGWGLDWGCGWRIDAKVVTLLGWEGGWGAAGCGS